VPIDAKLAEQLYRRAHADRWRVPRERFAEALERSAERDADVRALHLEDLALACGCAASDEAAWEHFIREQRPTLYRSADALDPSGSARDLADGIYGELFERSLFRYFHGRSSLSTWLRAILAQRHVDRLRAGRRLEPLSDDESRASRSGPADRLRQGGSHRDPPGSADLTDRFAVRRGGPPTLHAKAEAGPCDAERPRYFVVMRDALARAVANLPPRDRFRLACYYAQGLTLAEIGRLLGEHEATCSRQLARTRKVLRSDIEGALRTEGRLNEAEIAECVASVSEDAGPLDLRELLHVDEPVAVRKKSPADRSTLRERA
jgi:RNA polymerase sigma factor (sigma-70 family)